MQEAEFDSCAARHTLTSGEDTRMGMYSRKMFGWFLPGFLWVAFILLAFPDFSARVNDQLAVHFSGTFFHILFVLLASVVIGGISIRFAFTILHLVNTLIDWCTSSLARRSVGWHKFFVWCSDNLQLLSPKTISDEIAIQKAGAESITLAPTPEQTPWQSGRSYKLYLLQHAPALAKEAFDIEGDINFVAGVTLPLIAAGKFAAYHSVPGAVWFFLLALYCTLRFQHMRHHEVVFTAQAYKLIQAEK